VSNGRTSVKYNYADLQTFPEGDGKRYEIIDGDLLVTPSPMSRHQLVLGTFHWWIRSYLEENPIGMVLFAPPTSFCPISTSVCRRRFPELACPEETAPT